MTQELVQNWKRVLQAFHKCNLRFSAHKTIISLKFTTFLVGSGTLVLSPSVQPPEHLSHLPCVERFWSINIVHWRIQSPLKCHFKVFKLPRFPGCRNSRSSYVDSIDDFRAAFRRAQNALSFALTITFPRPEDQPWIVNDEAVRYPLCNERRKVTCVWFLQRPGIWSFASCGTTFKSRCRSLISWSWKPTLISRSLNL